MAKGETCRVGKNCSIEKQTPTTNHWGTLCGKHRSQMRRHGKILHTTKYEPRDALVVGDNAHIPIGINGKDGFVVVDREFAYLAKFKWYLGSGGYAYCSSGGKQALHRKVASAKKGDVVDHIDGDRTNCRSTNLRICTQAENARNQKLCSLNTTGYKGVTATRSGRFTARIKKDYKYRHIGVFDTAAEAAKAYNEAAKLLHGEYARLNYVR